MFVSKFSSISIPWQSLASLITTRKITMHRSFKILPCRLRKCFSSGNILLWWSNITNSIMERKESQIVYWLVSPRCRNMWLRSFRLQWDLSGLPLEPAQELTRNLWKIRFYSQQIHHFLFEICAVQKMILRIDISRALSQKFSFLVAVVLIHEFLLFPSVTTIWWDSRPNETKPQQFLAWLLMQT